MEIAADRIRMVSTAEPLSPNTENANFSTVLKGTNPPANSPVENKTATLTNPIPDGPGPATLALTALVEGTIGAGTRVDAMLSAVRRGKTFSPAELLALQCDVSRYSQSVEVLSRTTDRLLGGLKQILNTQV
ncbi:MAG: hypothetical protein SGI86_17865 [Deltaproteobacteria bacterium]|nr:hypothetical protein [Deltaproteobacteria bacterium]